MKIKEKENKENKEEEEDEDDDDLEYIPNPEDEVNIKYYDKRYTKLKQRKNKKKFRS